MEIIKSGNIKILDIDRYSDIGYHNIKDFDIVLMKEGPDDLPLYPEKIVFEMEIPQNFDEFLAKFESSKRSSIRKRIRDSINHFDIVVEDQISLERFTEWLEGYNKFISNLQDGRLNIELNSFEERRSTHFAVYFVDKNTKKIEGGALVKKFDNKKKISMSFAWYSEPARNTGCSTCLVETLVEYGNKHGYKSLSFGQDTNLYGGHLSLGLYEYKSGWKTTVHPAGKSEIKKILQANPVKNKFIYFIFKGDNLIPIKSYE